VADALGLYLRLIAASLRAQLAHRSDFWLGFFGTWLTTATEGFALWALFHRFESVQGWTLPEVAMLFGVVHVAFALADSVATGFDQFAHMVRQGEFDRLLLRPRSPALLLIGQELTLRRAGRLLLGALALVWGAHALELAPSVLDLLVLALAVAGGACLFCGLFVLQAAAAFWTHETLEVFNAFSYGGKDLGQYPITLYRSWLRRLFSYGVPLALVSYFPILFVLGRADPLGSTRPMQALAPLAGPIFLLGALLLFQLGVRRYTSSGS
jgi:viologen exporter family transport system permease protein